MTWTSSFYIYILFFMAPPGRGGRPIRCRTGIRGRVESGEHLGPCSEADRDTVHGQLQLLHARKRSLLAVQQCGSFWEGSIQTPSGGVSGASAQGLTILLQCPSFPLVPEIMCYHLLRVSLWFLFHTRVTVLCLHFPAPATSVMKSWCWALNVMKLQSAYLLYGVWAVGHINILSLRHD